jgi:hypothetical protein
MLLVGRRSTKMGGPIFNQPVEGLDTGRGYGVRGSSNSREGYGVYGSSGFMGVHGSSGFIGVSGYSQNGYGVGGYSDSGNGVGGYSDSDNGVWGRSDSGNGVYGSSYDGLGVYGTSMYSYGVYGSSPTFIGVFGISISGSGVYGSSYDGYGVYGSSENYHGVMGYGNSGDGVHGRSYSRSGVYGQSDSGAGVYGLSNNYYGVYAFSNSPDWLYGLYAGSYFGYAAYLDGNVIVTGNLSVSGNKNFKIDHPLDPSNKYLYHSCVESSDMKNVYDGVVVLDDKGEAEIKLPDWFGALNKDFRYQLTAIGAPGPNLYIAEEISDDVTNDGNSSSNNNNNNNSRFKIAGGTSGMKVSWQVTGIRQDPYAKAHPIQVEEDKPAKERGYYLYPELYGQPEEKGISRLLFPKEEEKQELLINKS